VTFAVTLARLDDLIAPKGRGAIVLAIDGSSCPLVAWVDLTRESRAAAYRPACAMSALARHVPAVSWV